MILKSDVLVIGGGPAGAWAAITAAAAGASVALADKGYCGSSGAAAASGSGIIYTKPDPETRSQAIQSRYTLGGGLSDPELSMRVLEQTHDNMHQLVEWGYPCPVGDGQLPYLKSLQGPEYMRLMRKRVKKAGVRILDHSPALELLVDEEGVGGAAGVRLQEGDDWRVEAGAVVIATGGCAFLSNALGSNVLTGDGYLLGAEAGADMSGMEFSNAYYICPTFSSVTKGAFYRYATFYRGDGTPIEGADAMRGKSIIARTLLQEPVYCRLDRAPEHLKPLLRYSQSIFFLPFERMGIDPFTELFPITLRFEGTVRGTGGLDILNERCETRVPGLYAAGDAATRELFCGAATGGGSHNSAWAMSSGVFAGKAAASYGMGLGQRKHLRVLRGANSARTDRAMSVDKQGVNQRWRDHVNAVQQQVAPYELNLFRSGDKLKRSLDILHRTWRQVSAEDEFSMQMRQAEAMSATARWMYASALLRTESRGMHRREDYPATDARYQHRIVSGGLDRIWAKPLKDGGKVDD
ncbi:FAD-dependent oxidoreductase [Cohnella cellulosilytica]|uniref:FAD-dependent oxidoreductase n=1 Tax=Cohnella cellulosilytica TaxID=986710 RepID=A0ABW2FA53_9BACL